MLRYCYLSDMLSGAWQVVKKRKPFGESLHSVLQDYQKISLVMSWYDYAGE
jgi:hypothetical protein